VADGSGPVERSTLQKTTVGAVERKRLEDRQKESKIIDKTDPLHRRVVKFMVTFGLDTKNIAVQEIFVTRLLQLTPIQIDELKRILVTGGSLRNVRGVHPKTVSEAQILIVYNRAPERTWITEEGLILLSANQFIQRLAELGQEAVVKEEFEKFLDTGLIVLLDLNGLKGFNDIFGYAGGDLALQLSAKFLTSLGQPEALTALGINSDLAQKLSNNGLQVTPAIIGGDEFASQVRTNF
jgi:hypothetical protein